MAKFSNIEKRLMKRIIDDRLCSSLTKIREAMEDIWAIDAPRIVQDYTDHGTEHSERIVQIVAKLLQANNGKPLSVQETYLLLASIYLHDIGMQCDVVKFPEIKEIAEKHGAVFELEFIARTSSSYSANEQANIRKNHNYLSAAWIDYAYRIGNTILSPAVRTIPDYLVNDLIDVCMYHAKLPINDCSSAFELDPTERKRLVAALLRFADELDVDKNRVNEQTVKTYSLDASNAIYWWIHSRTKVIFLNRNLILLNLRLHPDDARRYGDVIKTEFISSFQSKNNSVINVLTVNNMPIVISDYSRVIAYDRCEPLPIDICYELKNIQRKRNQQIRQPQLKDKLGQLTSNKAKIRKFKDVLRYQVAVYDPNCYLSQDERMILAESIPNECLCNIQILNKLIRIVVDDWGPTSWMGVWEAVSKDENGEEVFIGGQILINIHYLPPDSPPSQPQRILPPDSSKPRIEQIKECLYHEYGHHWTMCYAFKLLEKPFEQRYPLLYYDHRKLSRKIMNFDIYKATTYEGFLHCDKEVIAEDFKVLFTPVKTHMMEKVSGIGYPPPELAPFLANMHGKE